MKGRQILFCQRGGKFNQLKCYKNANPSEIMSTKSSSLVIVMGNWQKCRVFAINKEIRTKSQQNIDWHVFHGTSYNVPSILLKRMQIIVNFTIGTYQHA